MTTDTAIPFRQTPVKLLIGLFYLLGLLACACNAIASATPPLQAVTHAAVNAPSPRNIQFTRVTSGDGLSQASANAIVQDHHG